MAMAQPAMLCSQAPREILEACAADSEPTRFLEEFFAAGYTQWRKEAHASLPAPNRFQVNNAVIVLWLRACRLHTCLLMGETSPDWDKPFFCDDGLY